MTSIIKVNTIQDAGGNALLTSNGSGTITTNNIGGQNTPAFEAFLSANQTISDNTATKIQVNSEVYDTNSDYDNSSNYRFTPTVAGKYFVYSMMTCDTVSGANMDQTNLYLYKNGSTISRARLDARGNTLGASQTVNITRVVDMNGSSDYLEIFAAIDDTSGDPQVKGSSTNTLTNFGAYKIIE
jgi:hypothetical protein